MKSTFEAFVAGQGQTAETLDPASALRFLSEFLGSTWAEDAKLERLYVSWGTYALGSGPFFQYSIWCDFYVGGSPRDDVEVWELDYTFRFQADDETTRLGEGYEMCSDPKDAADFRRSVEALPMTAYIGRATPLRSIFSLHAE